MSQMSSNFASSWQKHTPGEFETNIYTALHITYYMFVLYLVKNGNDFYGIQYSVKYEVSHKRPVVTLDNYQLTLTVIR